MKRLIKTGLVSMLLAHAPAHALNVVQGWYGGIVLGINYTPTTYFTLPDSAINQLSKLNNPPINYTLSTYTGSVSYQTMGQLGLQTGYRCNQYRVEGQLMFNNSPFSKVQFGNRVIESPSNNQYFTFKGATNTLAGMINGFYDFVPTDSESALIPYVGIGIGYAGTQNSIQMDFWIPPGTPPDPTLGEGVQQPAITLSRNTSSIAGQAIIGASYFIDDFTNFGLDLRYFTTTAKSQILDSRVQYLTVNLSFNGAFNLG